MSFVKNIITSRELATVAVGCTAPLLHHIILCLFRKEKKQTNIPDWTKHCWHWQTRSVGSKS